MNLDPTTFTRATPRGYHLNCDEDVHEVSAPDGSGVNLYRCAVRVADPCCNDVVDYPRRGQPSSFATWIVAFGQGDGAPDDSLTGLRRIRQCQNV